jgi:hypothetical protein
MVCSRYFRDDELPGDLRVVRQRQVGMETTMKSLVTHAIESVAGWIAEGGLAYETDDDITVLLRQNEEGWTVDVSAPLGGIVRHEGVHLSRPDLRAALVLGTQWRERPLYATPSVPVMNVTEALAIVRNSDREG